MLREGEELVNDGSNVALVVVEQVAVKVKVEETHAVERLEFSGILLSRLDSSGGGRRDASRRDGGDGDGRNGDGRNLLLSSNNVNPDASTEGRSRGTMHAPIRDVTTELLGSLHLDGDGNGGLGRNLAGNLNKLDSAQTITSVGLEGQTAAKRPGSGTAVRQTPNLGESLTSSNLGSVRDGNVAQKGHLELIGGHKLGRRDNGARVGSGLNNLRLHGLKRKHRGGDDSNGLLGQLRRLRRGKGRSRRGNRVRRGVRGRRVVSGRSLLRRSLVVPRSMMRAAVPAVAASGSVGASGIHGKSVVLVRMSSTEAARVAQVEVRASIALMDGALNGRSVASVANVSGVASQKGARRRRVGANRRRFGGGGLRVARRKKRKQRGDGIRAASISGVAQVVQEGSQVNVQDVGRGSGGLRGSRGHERGVGTTGDEVEAQQLLLIGERRQRDSVVQLRVSRD